MQQDREAYLEAGSGSATDSATSEARHKMVTTVEARIVSNVVKLLRYGQEGCVEMKDDVTVISTYLRRKGGETARDSEFVPALQVFFYTLVLYLGSHIHLHSPPVSSMSEDVVILA